MNARALLAIAMSHLVEGGDWAKALDAVNEARALLEPQHVARDPHPSTMIGRR